MRRLILALMLPVACCTLMAEQTGRIAGKVLDKDGKPVAGAKVTLKRTDRNWTKDLFPDKSGNYLQVGLEPKEYELTASADGFVDQKEIIKIPLADVLTKNITLLTPDQARAQIIAGGGQVVAEDPGAMLDAAGRDEFNLAIPLYNEGNFAEALPHVEKSYKALNEAKNVLKDEQAKADLLPELAKVERVLGICMAQAGEKKADAEPYLLKALAANAKDERVVAALIATSKDKKDAEAEKKYAAMLETLQGPNPDMIYNKGVEAFNDGKTKEAKAHLMKALEVDPNYAKAHYLLGMVEYASMNLKGTKQHFLKYLELAPKGEKAAEIKEMLNDPSLKSIK